MAAFNEFTLFNWFAKTNYLAMSAMNHYWWTAWFWLFFVGCLIGMAPLKMHHEQPFYQIVFIQLRRLILLSGVLLISLPMITWGIYVLTMENQLADPSGYFKQWFFALAKANWLGIVIASAIGWSIRFIYCRYVDPFLSSLLRNTRNAQTQEAPSDIRQEAQRFAIKDFLPSKLYQKHSILIGLGEDNKPIQVPIKTWHETNMQVIGPTRYGKGIIIGSLLDQIIARGDTLFYIDPKQDAFAPHIMYQACLNIVDPIKRTID